jgi:hypothetical protein
MPRMFREFEVPRFVDSRHLKVVRMLATNIGCLYLPGNIPSTHFSSFQPQGHSATGKIMSMKITVTPSGIEPANFRFVTQCLNQPRASIRLYNNRSKNKNIFFKFLAVLQHFNIYEIAFKVNIIFYVLQW